MSLKLVPFESLGAVSYSPSIVTMAVSVSVCEIFIIIIIIIIKYICKALDRSATKALVSKNGVTLSRYQKPLLLWVVGHLLFNPTSLGAMMPLSCSWIRGGEALKMD